MYIYVQIYIYAYTYPSTCMYMNIYYIHTFANICTGIKMHAYVYISNGIEIFCTDLETSFGAKEMFRQGGTIREFENVGRLQGESVHAFVRRFRLLERKLQDNKVPEYPEPARSSSFSMVFASSLLLAAGNRDMKAILDAISIQYPAGKSITGLPRLRLDSRRGRERGSTSSARSLSASSSRPPSSTSSGKRWRQWATSLENDNHDDVVDTCSPRSCSLASRRMSPGSTRARRL